MVKFWIWTRSLVTMLALSLSVEVTENDASEQNDMAKELVIKKAVLLAQFGILKNDDWTKHPEELLKSMLANHCKQICIKSGELTKGATEYKSTNDFEEINDQLNHYCCRSNNIFEEQNEEFVQNLALNFEKSERKMEEILTELTTVAETTATKTSAKSLSPEKAQTVQAVHKVLQLIEQQLEVGPAKNALKQFLGKGTTVFKPIEILQMATTLMKIRAESATELANLENEFKQNRFHKQLTHAQKRRLRREIISKQQSRIFMLLVLSAIVVYAAFVILTIIFNTLNKAMEQPIIYILTTFGLFYLLQRQKGFLSDILPSK
ncbi:hypothetical protein GPALN_010826 [Globodera pallida]|nr:hypothetical protein GPALN_010826 [Globodera pallida]